MFSQAVAVIIALASVQGPKRPIPRHVFVYDPVALEAFNREQQAKLSGGAPPNASLQTTPEAKPGKKPTSPPPSYVNISGNFGGVFYVAGVGNGTSQSQTNLINITTNRSVTFSANSFNIFCCKCSGFESIPSHGRSDCRNWIRLGSPFLPSATMAS